jgi:hydroxypyruvate reductase
MIEYRDRLAESEAHEVALSCIEAGIEAATPQRVVRDSVAVDGGVLSVGEATYDLGEYSAVLVLGEGLVVATDPVAVDAEAVDVVEGSHPVPDEDGQAGARRVIDRAREADDEVLVLVPITGGGSALLPLPAGDVSLDDLRDVTADLVESGAAIEEINAVRKHLSAIKGGGLAAAAAPATVVSLVFSDVVGDDPGVIASGPTAPDETTYGDALAVLDRYEITVPSAVRDHLEDGAEGERSETPEAGDDAFRRVDNHVLANAWTALSAARETAVDAGYEPLVLSSRVRGEATEAALTHLAVAEECRGTGHPVEPPAVVLSGGETTVSVLGGGEGGPNLEFALRAGIEGSEGIVCVAVDTDGSDGGTDAAGAIVDAATVSDERAARRALVENESYEALDDRGALVYTGPTGTNVNDLRAFVVPDRSG